MKGLTALVTGPSKQEAIEAMIGRAVDEFGAIDVLVNNAGIQHVAPIDEFPCDMWQQGITMNAICPGYAWTPLVERQIPDTAKARGLTEAQVVSDVLLHAQPTKRFVQAAEVAALAAFPASREAASITGAIIPIDGGWTAQ